jgi:type IV secretory pathway protease TraF
MGYRRSVRNDRARNHIRGAGPHGHAARIVNGEVIVPPGKYFVLGDNRDKSLYSRYFGLVDAADLSRKPLLIYGSRPL